jgi:hypothetical protein
VDFGESVSPTVLPCAAVRCGADRHAANHGGVLAEFASGLHNLRTHVMISRAHWPDAPDGPLRLTSLVQGSTIRECSQ